MPEELMTRWIDGIDAVDPAQWDALALGLATPFLEWRWLHLLESSGSACPARGWTPHHLTVWSGDDLVAAAPFYVKTTGSGEFLDYRSWYATGRQGLRRASKRLVGMVPFTPLSAYRFLMAKGVDPAAMTLGMAGEIQNHCRQHAIGSWHLLFVDPQWQAPWKHLGHQVWGHPALVWENPGCRDFSDYLAGFGAVRRRSIRREQAAVARAGIDIEMVAGPKAPALFFEWMFEYYTDTNRRYDPQKTPYLTEAFFAGLERWWRHRLVFAAAWEQGLDQPLALALLAVKGDRLWGRYWGRARPLRHLHFATCVYGPIQWAIANRIRWFNPGPGGDHKRMRGFVEVPSYSVHRFTGQWQAISSPTAKD